MVNITAILNNYHVYTTEILNSNSNDSIEATVLNEQTTEIEVDIKEVF
jgi:hypothetical protein